mgnify:CR=1 FL=1
MVQVTFTDMKGKQIDVDVEEGTTVMQAAFWNGVEGIVAECGGSATCATCHIYVDETFLDKVPPPSPEEEDMLDFVAAERRPCSRLGCQIVLDSALSGIHLHIPERQQ